MIEDPLLTPFNLKGLTLRNRIVSTSHEPSYSDEGLPKDRYRAYHVEKAKGGVALTMIGGSAVVTRDSAPAFGNLQLWRDESVRWLRLLADEVHDHGALVMTQITHMGQRNSSYNGDWLPVVSASDGREPAHRGFSKAAERWDLDRIRDGFVSTAQRCQEAGLDGVELMVYGHFLDSFWSPFWNWRDDDYNGSYENRVRYPLEVVRAVRAAVGPDFVVGARMTFDELRDPGLGTGEALRIAGDLSEAGIDFFSIIKGSIETDAAVAAMIPPMGTPASPHLEFAGRIRQQLNVPVMHAAKIADVATARHAVRDGLLDLVGMTRAILADPYLPTKIAQHKEDQIRPCVGANMCIDGIYTMGAAYCMHNPSTGRELELPQLIEPSPLPRRVAVIGAGPAGLEAARVLGERGHQVTLFEANATVGGQLSLAARSPRRRDLQGIIDWRVAECARLGVEVKTNAYVQPEGLLDQDWDVIIVATGGIPAKPSIPGGQSVLDSWDIISGDRHPTGRVLVYDDQGGNQALDVAETLGRSGANVELVTPERAVAVDVGGLVASYYFAALAELGVQVTVLRRLKAVKRVGKTYVATFGIDGSSWTETKEYDQVVVECGTTANAEVYDGLVAASLNGGEVNYDDLLALKPQTPAPTGAGFQLFRIGDAIASRNVHAAMLDAARLCRGI